MRIALAQLNFTIGDFSGNLERMTRAVEEARAQSADLICFPELAVCGYPPQDLLEYPAFMEQCAAAIATLTALSHDMAIVVGAPVVNPQPEGKRLFNAALFLAGGALLHVHHKALLPTYDVFDEYRYFEPGTSFQVVEWRGYRIALTVCEDIWNVGNPHPLYAVCPLDAMAKQQPDFILNLSASPFSYRQAGDRLHTLRANARRYGIPLFYVNQVGAHAEIIFDGGSLALNAQGEPVAALASFREDLKVVDLDALQAEPLPEPEPTEKIALIHDALVLGVRDFFQKQGFRKAILGLSGGIDSAVTAALLVEALGPEAVTGVAMPSRYSSAHSVEDARQLAENLGMHFVLLPIEPAYQTMLRLLQPHFEDRPFDLTEENLQARIRGQSLMALANKQGLILLNTTNKSEMAVGYGTLYGDLCGGLSVLGDVYKTEVYALAAYINRQGEKIPLHSITKPPSAELRPEQKDSDSLPDYAVLDPILQAHIEERKSPGELASMGYAPDLINRVLRLVHASEFKRFQTAPVLRISPKAFGSGRRMPLVARFPFRN